MIVINFSLFPLSPLILPLPPFFSKTVASSLTDLGPGKCIALQANLKSKAACEQVASEISAREDKLHILVNNAGVVWVAPLDNIPENGWDHVNKLNVYAVYFLTMA